MSGAQTVEIACATMNTYPYDLPGRPDWGSDLEATVPFLERTGFRNYELHPTEAIVTDVQRRAARGDTGLVNSLIGSQHQTFFEGEGLVGKLADHRGVYRNEESIEAMTTVQRVLRQPVPTVYYFPHKFPERELTDENTAGAQRIIQTASEAYRDLGVDNFQDFAAAVGRFGIAGLCPDTFHHRRGAADGTPAPATVDDWGALHASGLVYQDHIAGDRRDLIKRDPEVAQKTVGEFQAFSGRSWQRARGTELGDMVTAAVETWQPPQALGHTTLRMVCEFPPMPTAILRREAQQARFVENLANIIHEAGAEPLLWTSAA